MKRAVAPRQWARQAVIAMTALIAACSVLSAPSRTSAPTTDLGAPGVRFMGLTDTNALVDVTLALRLPGRDRLQMFLELAQDPGGRRFGQTIDPVAFGKRFGLSAGELARVEQVLGGAGLVISAEYPQRTALQVQGRAQDVGDFFDVDLGEFISSSGGRFRAPIGQPRIPLGIRGSVIDVVGLDTRPAARPASAVAAIPHPDTGLTPEDAADAYDITRLHQDGYLGQGQTIAVLSLATIADADIEAFDRAFGITDAPPVEHVLVDGGAGPTEGDPNCETEDEICHSSEVNLDVDVIRGIAPQAQILNYEAPNGTDPFAAVINQIVEDGRADIVSISWGSCDVPGTRSQATEQALEAAEASGISIFVASGDAGAYDCQSSDTENVRPTVDYPASSSHVVGVGGTLLSVREDGSYLEEVGWEDVLEGSGGGGGLSPVEQRPSWQTGPGVQNDLSNGNRQVPDVAAAADPDSGFAVYFAGDIQGIGGTSAAAPFWAASMLLVRQVAQDAGIEGLGFVNPMLYQIAANPQSAAFQDVVRGGNRLYNCTEGWDFATGLGSPDVYNLARAAVAFLQSS